MIDYRIIKFNNGDSVFCIVEEETENTISVIFPMILKEHTFILGPNSVRETYSAAQFCPFTDDKKFVFSKPDLSYIKPLNTEAIPYYIGLLNKNETIEMLQKYNLSHLVSKDNEEEVEVIEAADLVKEINEIADRLGLTLDEEQEEEIVKNVINGNKTVH